MDLFIESIADSSVKAVSLSESLLLAAFWIASIKVVSFENVDVCAVRLKVELGVVIFEAELFNAALLSWAATTAMAIIRIRVLIKNINGLFISALGVVR